MGPLMACFDLETSNLDPMWGVLLCSDTKAWNDPKHTTFIHELEQGYNDREVVEKTIDHLNNFEILSAHNGVFFDRKFLNGRALYHHLTYSNGKQKLLDPKMKIVDPWRLAKNHLNFRGNSLDRISDFLHTSESKSKVDGETWMKAVYNRDYDALEYIVKHCILDVNVLEEVTWEMRGFMGNITPWGSA